ncbi:MAG: glycosyl transferase [Candidatus Binatia bacterium]|nr:MAG: glycosyl transferase [Candidatus Binatia bacterium]
MTLPSVAVVVVHWNRWPETRNCLRSLARLTYPNREVVVVDNGSRTPIEKELAREFPWATRLRLERNTGYTGGNNAALRYALGRGHEYFFLLNNDAVVAPDCVEKALEVAESDERIGVLGMKVLSLEDPSRIWVAYGQVTYRQGLVRLVGYLERDRGQYEEVRDVEWVPGTALFFRRRALETVGLLDDRFFAYHEDVDWCTSARALGFRVVYAPGPVVFHKGHGSSGGRGYLTPRQYLAGRSMVLFVRKHASPAQKAKFTLFTLGTLPLQYVRRLLRNEQGGVVLKARGLYDGWKGKDVPVAELGLV